MKKQLTIIILLFVAISLFSGCSNWVEIRNDFEKGSTVVSYASEQSDLLNAISNHRFSTELPKEYSLTASIGLLRENDADRIQYEIFIEKTAIKMENLIMSFYLEPKMFEKLNTSSVYQSNTLNDKPIEIGPTGDALGASLSRAFILDKKKIDSETKNIYKTIYAKISYGDKENRIVNYIKLDASASAEIEHYVNE